MKQLNNGFNLERQLEEITSYELEHYPELKFSRYKHKKALGTDSMCFKADIKRRGFFGKQVIAVRSHTIENRPKNGMVCLFDLKYISLAEKLASNFEKATGISYGLGVYKRDIGNLFFGMPDVRL
jgi:hypothetical protein